MSELIDGTDHESPAKPTGQEPSCPTCGSVMIRLPRLDGDGVELLCPRQHDAQDTLLAFERELAELWGTAPKSAARFRSLVEQADSAEPLPEALLDQLPDRARQLFEARQLHGEKQTAPLPDPPASPEDSPEPPPEAAPVGEVPAQAAKPPNRPRSSKPTLPDQITQEDIALLATELEPGAMADKERRLCSNCEAVIARNRVRCPWCGEILPPLPDWVD